MTIDTLETYKKLAKTHTRIQKSHKKRKIGNLKSCNCSVAKHERDIFEYSNQFSSK